jgi:hypothetical protein
MSATGGQFDQIVSHVKTGAGLSFSDQEITTKAYGQFFQHSTGSRHDGAAFYAGNRRWIVVLAIVFGLDCPASVGTGILRHGR